MFHILAILLTLAAFFPGQMSPDSINQLSQARSGVYEDMHQPIMAAFWRVLLHLWDNPGVLFTLHTLAYWFLFYLLALLAFQDWEKQFAVSLAACLPPLWSQIIVVWKDTELSIVLLGAYLFAILASRVSQGNSKGKKSLKYPFLGLSLLFFLYAAAVRENSMTATVPLMIYLVSTQWKKIKPFQAFLAACLIILCGLFAAYVLDYKILRAEKKYYVQVSEIFDIAGVFAITRQENLIPDYWKKLNPEVTPELLFSKYDPNSVILLISWGTPFIGLTSDQSQLRELREKWLEALLYHPLAFFEHRWKVFKSLMGVGMPKTYYPYHFGIEENNLGVQDHGDPFLNRAFRTYFSFFRNSAFFRGWAYLAALLLLMLYQFKKYPAADLFKKPEFCAVLSGFFYGAGYFFYAPAADFRFLYPTVLLFFLALVLTVAGFNIGGKEPIKDGTKGSTKGKGGRSKFAKN